MEKKDKEMQCSLCGFTASGKFVGDICPKCDLTFGFLRTRDRNKVNLREPLSMRPLSGNTLT